MATSSPRKTRRYLAAAGLLAGGVTIGALFSPVGLAGAAEGDTETTETETETETETSTDNTDNDGRQRGDRGEKLKALSELLGMEPEAIHEARHDGQSLVDIAAGQGVSEEELVSALSDILPNADEERLAERANGEGASHGGLRHRFAHRAGQGVVAEVTEALGISETDLRDGLADEKTLAEIAGEQGVGEDDLVDALVAAANERIDEAVAEDKIDADRAEEAKAKTEERMTALVNRDIGDRSTGRSGHGHNRGSRGDDTADTSDTSDTSDTVDAVDSDGGATQAA